MGRSVQHTGKVISVNEDSVDVVVEAPDACIGCKAKDICITGEGKEKQISVYTPSAYDYAVGEEVEVSMEQVMGMKAVFIAYMLPFLLVFFSLLIMIQTGLGELLSGSVALAMLALYYVGLYIFRNKIEREIVFKIGKIYD